MAGVATDIALSPARTQLAYVMEPKDNATAQIVLLDLSNGEHRTIETERAEYVGDLRWSGSGSLLYRTYAKRKGGDNHELVVAEGAKTSRLLARDAWLKAGPGSDVAYVECIDGKQTSSDCEQRLIVDAAGGGSPRVLAEKGRFEPFAFTPDGRHVLTIERIDGAQRLMRRSVEGGAPLDLDIAQPLDGAGTFGSWVSPDSREALVRRAETLVAVKLDGSGERIIASGGIRSAGFISVRGVLYELTENLAPGNDVPKYVRALGYHDGERPSQVADFAPSCSWPTVSRTGRLVARPCEHGVSIYSLETGKQLRAIPKVDGELWPPLGFDGRELGLVVAYGRDGALGQREYVLRFHGLDGVDRELGIAHTHAARDGHVARPLFAFGTGRD